MTIYKKEFLSKQTHSIIFVLFLFVVFFIAFSAIVIFVIFSFSKKMNNSFFSLTFSLLPYLFAGGIVLFVLILLARLFITTIRLPAREALIIEKGKKIYAEVFSYEESRKSYDSSSYNYNISNIVFRITFKYYSNKDNQDKYVSSPYYFSFNEIQRMRANGNEILIAVLGDKACVV